MARGGGARVFHARRSEHDVLEVGFAAYRAHHIVSIDRCPVLAPALAGAIAAAWALAEALGAMKKPLDIQVTATDAGLDVDVRGSGALPPQRAAALVRLAETHRLARLTRHGELIAQRAAPTRAHGQGARSRCRPARSCRRPPKARRCWRGWWREHVGGAKRVADLFCGVGPFALRLAERARVLAADADAGGDRRAAPGRQGAGPEAGRGAGARPVPPAAGAGGAEALRRGGVRSAAPGRRGAGARSLRRQRCRWSSRCRAMPRPSRATRASWSTAATG